MDVERNRERPLGKRAALIALMAALMGTLLFSVAAVAAPGNDQSAATITGSFGDSCRGFEAHSSKDISYVEVHYRDGRVVKDESVESQDFTLDGVGSDEIASAIVKSGTTLTGFDCESGPKAVCSDGIDNDGNGLIDFPADPYCSSPEDNDEGAD